MFCRRATAQSAPHAPLTLWIGGLSDFHALDHGIMATSISSALVLPSLKRLPFGFRM
jgi:hypothetical protein